MANLVEITVRARDDATAAVARINRQISQQLRRLRRDLDQLARGTDVDVRVRVVGQDALDDLRRDLARISDELVARVRVMITPRDAVDDLRRDLRDLGSLYVARLRVRVTGQDALADLREVLDRIRDDIIVARIRVDIDSIEEVRRFREELERIERNIRVRIRVSGDGADGGGLGGLLGSLRLLPSLAGLSTSALAKFAATASAAGAAALTAAPMLIKAGKELAAVGKAAVGAAPALVAFGVAGKVVAATLKAIFAEGSAMREMLKPISDGFKTAGENASKAASDGLKPLVDEFQKAVWPEINHTMVRIGTSVNRVAKEFGEWLKTTEGVAAVNGILHPIWQAVERMEPAVNRLVVSFTSMLGRIMDVSLQAGTNGLTGVLDRLSTAMDNVDAESVSAGIEKLKSTFESVRNAGSKVADVLKRVVDLYERYQTELSGVADAMAVAAIAFGGPAVAIAGAVTLVVKHFDDLREGYRKVVEFLKSNPVGQELADKMRNLATVLNDTANTALTEFGNLLRDHVVPFVRDHLVPAMNDIIPKIASFAATLRDDVIPVISQFAGELIDRAGPALDDLRQIITDNKPAFDDMVEKFKALGRTIRDDVLPAILGFIDAITPFVTWLNENLLPIVIFTFGRVADIVRGAFEILVGALEVFKSLFTGKWSELWSGLGNIVEGIWHIVEAILSPFKWLYDQLVGHSVIPDTINEIVAWFGRLPGLLLEVFAGALTWLLQAGRDIVQGLWDGLQEVWTTVSAWFVTTTTVTIPGFFAGAIGWLLQAGSDIMTGLQNGLTAVWATVSAWFSTLQGLIVGFFAGAVSWLVQAGDDVISGLWSGLTAAWADVTAWFGTLKGLITGFFGGAVGWLVEAGKNIIRGLINGIESMAGAVGRAVGKIVSAAKSAASAGVGAVLGAIPGRAAGGIAGGGGMASGGVAGPGRAAGGGARGALTWVGEQGRELVRLPYGSRVFPAGTSEAMARRAGGGAAAATTVGPISIDITINGAGAGGVELAAMVRSEVDGALGQVAQLIRNGTGRR